jgi:hypothetical protein
MKILIVFILMCHVALSKPESYFFRAHEELNSKIENGNLLVAYAIQKVDFKIILIEAYHQGLGEGRKYQIEIHAPGIGSKIGPPSLKLEDDLLTNVKYLAYTDGRQTMTIESDDRKKIEKWVAALRRLSGLPETKVLLKLDRKTEPQRRSIQRRVTSLFESGLSTPPWMS